MDKAMIDDRALSAALGSNDPLAAEDAVTRLAERPAEDILRVALPAGFSHQGMLRRTTRLAEAAGPELKPLLLAAFERGGWHELGTVAGLLGGFQGDETTAHALFRFLENDTLNIDAERRVIDSLGLMGASGYADYIANFAQYGTIRPSGFAVHDKYVFDKCWGITLEALGMMIAREPNVERKGFPMRVALEFAESVLKREPGRGHEIAGFLGRARWDFDEKAIDLIVQYWVGHEQPEFRKLGYEMLGEIKSVRMAPLLLERARAATDQSEREEALIALGELRDPRAADHLDTWLQADASDPGLWAWAYSTLYPLRDTWSVSAEDVQARLSPDREQAQQLLYSRALAGDTGIEATLVTQLDHAQAWLRGTAALSLARLMGTDATALLRGRDEEASDDLERCHMLAALARIGLPGKAARLHGELQKLWAFPNLRTIWKVELLDAFRAAEDFDQRAFMLWSEDIRLRRRAIDMFDGILERHGKNAEEVVAAAEVSIEARPPKLFISYAREDREWLDKLQVMLAPLLQDGELEIWEDSQIQPGKWHDQIDAAMKDADGAVFLASPAFFASDFVQRHELPDLLGYAERRDVKVFWLTLDYCMYYGSPLSAYQCHNDPETPLIAMSPAEQSKVLRDLSLTILRHIGNDAHRAQD